MKGSFSKKLIPAIKLAVFLFVLVGLLGASKQAVDRWKFETSALHTQVRRLQESAVDAADPHQAVALAAEAERLAERVPTLANVRWNLVGWAAALYAAGLFPPALVLHRCLIAFQIPCSRHQAIAAQLLGHAGKYIPGKAMVVVLRVGAILPKTNSTDGIEAVPLPIGRASTCVFFETLLMMGVGGAVAGVLLWNSPLPFWVRLFAAAMAIGSFVPVCPPVMRRLIAMIARRKRLASARRLANGKQLAHLTEPGVQTMDVDVLPTDLDTAPVLPSDLTSPISWRLLGWSYAVSLVSWVLIGSSFAVLIRAIPSPPLTLTFAQLAPIATAAISLGMVLGFASLLPGGAGVREYVTLLVLSPAIGQTHALLAVIAARLLFIAVEAFLAGLASFYLRKLQPVLELSTLGPAPSEG